MNWLSKFDRKIQSPFHEKVRRNYKMLMESQHWSRDEMKEYQLKRLRQVILFAKDNVPYYSDYFEGKELPESFSEFNNFPILERESAASQNDHLVSKKAPFGANPMSFITTSGSSGAKVLSQSTDIAEAMRTATALREFEWMDYDPLAPALFLRALVKPGDKNYDQLRTGIKVNQQTNDPLMSMYTTGDKYVIDTSASPQHVAKFMDAAMPQYILCFPSALRACIPYLEKQHQVRWIKTIGESLDVSTKQFFESEFGATIWNSYSCQELNSISFTGGVNQPMNIHEENVLVEILDENGTPSQSGRVILTNLHPMMTPFIRYSIGDIATLDSEQIGGLRNIASIDGRVFAQIRTPSGELILDSPIFVSLHALPGYSSIQLLQHNIHRFELLVKGSNFPTQRAREILESFLPWADDIKVTMVENIPRNESGKLLRFKWLGG